MQYCLFNGNGESVIIQAETIYEAYQVARSNFDNPEFMNVILEGSAKEMIERGMQNIVAN